MKGLIDNQQAKFSLESYVNTEKEKIAAELMQLSLEDLQTGLPQERHKLKDMKEDFWNIRDNMMSNIQS